LNTSYVNPKVIKSVQNLYFIYQGNKLWIYYAAYIFKINYYSLWDYPFSLIGKIFK
jgi:hypothetical protein